MNQKHIISALVENHSGVLAKIATLISGRGFNIDSLAVGETHDPSRQAHSAQFPARSLSRRSRPGPCRAAPVCPLH